MANAGLSQVFAEVRRSLFKQFWSLAEITYAKIALRAQHAANLAGGVVVINRKVLDNVASLGCLSASTNGAQAALSVVYRLVLAERQTELFQKPALAKQRHTPCTVFRLAVGAMPFGATWPAHVLSAIGGHSLVVKRFNRLLKSGLVSITVSQ